MYLVGVKVGFKHALTHEVAYSTLLHERRRGLHAQIVEGIEALSPDPMAEQVERLAHHALRGEVWDKAVTYLRQAGDKATTRSAFREAVAYWEQALTALPHLGEQQDTRAQAIDLRLALDNVLLVLGDPGGRSMPYLREAETLAEALDDQRRLGQICDAMSHHCWRRGDHDTAMAYAQRALTASGGDAFLQARACGHLGTYCFSLGEYRRAIDVLKQSMAILEGELRHTRTGMMVTSVRTRCWLSRCLEELGEFAEGRAYATEAVRIAEEEAHPSSAIFAQHRLGQLALRQGDLQHAIPILERALAQCQATETRLYLSGITASLGWAYAMSERVAEALPLLAQVVVSEDTALGGIPTMLRVGEAYFRAGRLAEAHALAARALTLARARQEGGHQAYALRLLGAIASHRDPPDTKQAETHYRQALILVEALGMRPLQAHCHRGLGTLYATTGQREQARAELSTAIEMYQAMAMTFWLPEAEAALAQVDA